MFWDLDGFLVTQFNLSDIQNYDRNIIANEHA